MPDSISPYIGTNRTTRQDAFTVTTGGPLNAKLTGYPFSCAEGEKGAVMGPQSSRKGQSGVVRGVGGGEIDSKRYRGDDGRTSNAREESRP